MGILRFSVPASKIVYHTNSLSHGSTGHANLIYGGTPCFIKFKLDEVTEQWDRVALCEVIASRLGKYLGLNMVTYELCLVDLMNGCHPVVGCISECYCDSDTIYTAQSLCDSELGLYHTTVSSLRDLGFSKDVDKLIAFDYIIGNKDRHPANIEFIALDVDEIFMSPIFDSGTSLLKTYAPYEATWGIDQITNNFLTHYHSANTFKSILAPVDLQPLADLNWERDIFYELEEYISLEEKHMITSFVTFRYNELLKRGLIHERRV